MKFQCIDTDLLDRYIDGFLPEQEKDQTEKHFLECDKCLERFVIAKELLEDPELTEYKPSFTDIAQTVLQNIKEAVWRFFEWLPNLSIPEWASAVRSAAHSSVFVIKEMDDLRTEVFVQKIKDDKARIFIKVFKDNKSAQNVNLKFGKKGRRPREELLLGDNVFTNEELAFGIYNLIVEQNDMEKGTCVFEINNKGLYAK
ncbi:MAG: zf-HC2 domain-containing protein [Desulfobacterales bacterium]|nr:zf-HC2 domain-containing protein [Desulfobacterales bacterium]